MTDERMTIRQIARFRQVDESVVAGAVQEVLGPPGSAWPLDRPLPPRQRELVLEVLGSHEELGAFARIRQPALIPDATADLSKPAKLTHGVLPFKLDEPSDPLDLTFPVFRHRIWLHPNVSDSLRSWTHIYRRLGIVLQHLAAHGRTTVVKGCSGGNRGWRRSPLGGHDGMQYYLWWTPQGSSASRPLNLPDNSILIRAVRHHDDHTPLAAGARNDYLELTRSDDLHEDFAGEPWTEAQIKFVKDSNPVRLLLGRPGSGKTTVLWKALEARANQQVLYLTWSSALMHHAMARFTSFAPEDVTVTARDFTTFLGEICGTDINRQSLAASRRRFDADVTRLGREMAGPWKHRRDALHAELRAIFFGRAIPGDRNCESRRGLERLQESAYSRLRGGPDGVGSKAAKALLKVARGLSPEAIRGVFPELVAATQAIAKLRQNALPDGFERIDRIVVDEVQDLTLIETAVVVELCGAIARTRKRAPWLLMAGDAGQTVRPTAFDWGPLKDLLSRRIGTPAMYQLEEHLRCPSRIAAVLDRATARYTEIRKVIRPTKQRRQRGGQHLDAHLIHVEIPDRNQAIALVENLEETDDVVLISPQYKLPAWIPERLRGSVLTPEETKGLEYQAVCVLDPGRLLSDLHSMEAVHDPELEQQAHRTAIDHLRVTLSRATETLVFIDVECSDDHRAFSQDLLLDGAPYTAEDLFDHFAHAETSAEERVLVRTRDARMLIDSAPRRAWQRARQAICLLGDPELPNGVSDDDIRQDARTTMLATAAHLLVSGIPDGVTRGDLVATARTALSLPDLSIKDNTSRLVHEQQEDHAFELLERWTRDRTTQPFDLLQAVSSIHAQQDQKEEWLRPALLPAAQTLREALQERARDPAWAPAFTSPDIEEWLRLTGYTGNVKVRAGVLRGRAFDTLLAADSADGQPLSRKDRLALAETILKGMPPDLRRLGRLHEAQGRVEDAVAAYERAGARKDVLRIWRNSGAWEHAVDLTEGDVRADLTWLLELKALVERRPANQNKRLRNGERDRLEKLLDVVQKRPGRKREAASRTS